MGLHFRRVVGDMEVWSAIVDGFSFVISYESPTGPGLHGKRTGFLASWRSSSPRLGAIRVTGSPFKTFIEAENACNNLLEYLTSGKT
jgi:hypothetical protein